MLDVRLPDFAFAFALDVWFRDLDAMGHVNNAVYFSYFEQARTRYWLSLLGEHDFHDFRMIGFIVVHAECDYASAGEMGDRLLVGCRVSEIRRSSFVFDYRIVTGDLRGSDSESRLVATGKTVQALYDWNTKKTVNFSEELRKKIERLPGVREATVAVVWDPPWSAEMMSDAGKKTLGIQ